METPLIEANKDGRTTGLAVSPCSPDFEPQCVDLSKKLRSAFGCVEFEAAACSIILYLRDAESQPSDWLVEAWGQGAGWSKKMRIDSIAEIDPTMFAMLCAAGWLVNTWSPKGTFIVSAGFIQRLQDYQANTADVGHPPQNNK